MSANNDIETVKRAKQVLYDRFHDSNWFRGVGIVPGDAGLKIRINVDPDSAPDVSQLPKEQDGVPVEVLMIKGYGPRGQ